MNTQRDLFDELVDGFKALAEARSGQRTLPAHGVKGKAIPALSTKQQRPIRKGAPADKRPH